MDKSISLGRKPTREAESSRHINEEVPPPPPGRSSARMGKLRSANQAPIAFRSSRYSKPRSPSAPRRGSTTDWADLGDGPAGLIAERVLADDVASYILFRSVCRSWRRCCDDPLTRGGGVLEDPRLRPRQWIMLLGEKEKLDAEGAPHRCRRQFLNVYTSRCIQVDVPELRDHGVIQSTTAEGLLFLHCKATGVVRLLNPLTRQMAELPPATMLCKTYRGYARAGLADDNTVFLYSFGEMTFTKPGDKRWVLLENNKHMPTPNVFFAGRLYCITNRAIMTVDTNRGEVVVAAKLDMQQFDGWVDRSVHLVDNGGNLVLVHRTTRRGTRDHRSYKVYRVDLEAGKVTTRGGVGLSLGGRAVFLARWHALSVRPQAFPSIDANTVYPGLSLSERGGSEQIGSYRIRDGSTESFGYDSRNPLPHPWSIADCLAAYVSAFD